MLIIVNISVIEGLEANTGGAAENTADTAGGTADVI